MEPRAFVIENVPEFQKSAEFAELRLRMATHPLLRGYGYRYGVLNAVEFRRDCAARRDGCAPGW